MNDELRLHEQTLVVLIQVRKLLIEAGIDSMSGPLQHLIFAHRRVAERIKFENCETGVYIVPLPED